MKLKIAVISGDGIGPEIMTQGVAVMDAIAAKFGHEVEYTLAVGSLSYLGSPTAAKSTASAS